MSGRTTRMARLVHLAQRREDHARQQVARARQGERAATDQVAQRQAELRAGADPAAPGFRFQHALGALGRDALGREEQHVEEAAAIVETQLSAWQAAHQRLGTLERLDERLHLQLQVERRLRQQQEADDLTASRHRGRA